MLSKNAVYLLQKRYCKSGESPEGVFKRVAEVLSEGDRRFEEKLFDLMVGGMFLPNSPCLFNAGTKNGNLHACFTLCVEDSLDSIFSSVVNMARIFKSGGGVGINYSPLRERGAELSGGGSSSGVLSFMGLFDRTVETVKQGGKRRGALIGILNYDHPEIFDFIKVKLEGKLQNFNLSILVNDGFMKMVGTDKKIDIISPKGYKVESVRATDIFEVAAFTAWCNGDPGLLFFDRINKDNPFYPDIKIDTCNPSLAKGTKVLTNLGIYPIELLEGKTFSVYTLTNSLSKASCFLSGRNKRLYKVLLKGGHEYYATEEHKWPVFHNGEYIKVRTDQLRTGDYIPFKVQDSLGYGSKGTYEEGFLVGWNLGDGALPSEKNKKKNKNMCFGFGSEDLENGIFDKIHNILKDITGFYYKRPEKSFSKSYFQITAGDPKLWKLFNELGVQHKSKGLPKLIWSECSEEFRRGLIDGLFSADASFSKHGTDIVLYSSFRNLVFDVSDLLGFYGIKTNIGYRRKVGQNFPNRKIYTLVVPRASTYYFNRIFKLSHPRKQSLLEKMLKPKDYIKSNKSRDHIRVVKVIPTDQYENVWDIRVEDDSHTFKLSHCITGNCSEVSMPAYSACCLGSINLSKFIWKSDFNFDRFEDVCKVGMRVLSTMNKVSTYPMPEITETMEKYNPVGLGIMGFADCLIKLGIKYDSKECLSFIDQLGEVYKRVTEEYNKDKFYFYRRIIAPTGSLSILADCSSGVEPVFDTAFEKRLTVGVIEEMKDLYKSEFTRTAHQVSPEWHVKVLAQWQKWIDGGVSKTINLPHDASVNDIKGVYRMAWELGCKGITVYRDGCRGNDNQVLVSKVSRPGTKCADESCLL